MDRQAESERKTTETHIRVSVNLDGRGRATVDTGLPFLDHMLTLMAKHGFLDLEVRAVGDLKVDAHHTMEDLGIVLGTALREALGDKRGIRRYDFFILPMDEALARVVLDLSGRPCLVYQVACPVDYVSEIDVRLFREFFQALTNALGLNLHIDLIRGDEAHHIFEAVFKAYARALAMAVGREPREPGIPSTKGVLV